MPHEREEKWLPVPGYEGLYSVSDFGRLRREVKGGKWPKGYITRGCLNAYGYRMTCLTKDGQKLQVALHRLVAWAFIGPQEEGIQVNHIDAAKSNNDLYNLEYVTPGENVRHAWGLGLITCLKGMETPQSKLTDCDVANIRLLNSAQVTLGELSRRFPVREQVIHSVLTGKTWRHITRKSTAAVIDTLGLETRYRMRRHAFTSWMHYYGLTDLTFLTRDSRRVVLSTDLDAFDSVAALTHSFSSPQTFEAAA